MGELLKQLRYKYIPIDSKHDFFSKENRIYLISDCYGSHCCQSSVDFATLLNIDIITIPKGMTSKFQPLDVGVNGIIIEEGKKFINEEAIDEIMNLFDSHKGQFEGQIPIIDAISKKDAAAVLYCIWENISESDIIDAFEDSNVQYFNDIEIDQDFSEDLEFQQRLEQLQSSQKDQTQYDEQNQSGESESETDEDFESNEIEEQPLTQEQKSKEGIEIFANALKNAENPKLVEGKK